MGEKHKMKVQEVNDKQFNEIYTTFSEQIVELSNKMLKSDHKVEFKCGYQTALVETCQVLCNCFNTYNAKEIDTLIKKLRDN